jgi:hypothetical protein
MRKFLPAAGLAVLALPLWAAPMTQGERDRALSELHSSRKQFLDAVEGLTAAQWNFKPDAQTWSVAECAEHIALSEDLIFGGMVMKMMQGPAQPGRREVADEAVLTQLRDRSQKGKAPEALQPKRKWANRDEVAAHFRESRDRTLDYVRETQEDVRSRFGKAALGNLDAYQWILLVSAHSERHTAQIREVMSHPQFPNR